MTDTIEKINQETFETLVPWYVTGQLSDQENSQVRQFLADNPKFEIQLKLIEDEREQAIAGNEALGSPSPGAFDRFMNDIAAEQRSSQSWLQRVNSWLEPVLGWMGDMRPLAMAAAVLVIVVQMGAIGMLVSKSGEKEGVRVASGPSEAVQKKQGSFVLVQFSQATTVAQVKEFFDKNEGIIVVGLADNGLYQVRVSETVLERDALNKVIDKRQSSSPIVEQVFPAAADKL